MSVMVEHISRNVAIGSNPCYRKAGQCLQALRQGCLLHVAAPGASSSLSSPLPLHQMFNEIIRRDIKDKFLTGRHARFWEEFVKKEGVTLITRDEALAAIAASGADADAATTRVTAAEAHAFLYSSVDTSAAAPVVKMVEVVQEEEDLFASME